MNNKTKELIIKEKFKSGFQGIIFNSGGISKLLCTKFNLGAVILTLIISVVYYFNISKISEEIRLIDALISISISLLSGIVGLSLAGLTLIITFSNPEVIEYCSKNQFEQFEKENYFNVSYYQKAVAKFAFIVFFQVCTLIIFFTISIFRGFNIEICECYAHLINAITFCFGFYFIVFSLILVLVSILNLFTFSQTSNFFNFMKYRPNIGENDQINKSSD
jgi:hypothetical protein